ncbi:MAG: hypothetical protein PHR81_01390 [Bacteroidales bacterium]|jgi:hypothetical protein|nr:hypothetical protein [Bacteroidales bacterium]MDD4213442.1 hypothetical protein [Bacteroidales bacterium]
MKQLVKLFLVALLIITSFSACKKYEDGDTFSWFVKMYIVNDWKIEKRFLVNSGVDITPTNNYWIKLSKDYRYTEYQADTVSSEGSWTLDGEKMEFIVVPDEYFGGMAQLGFVYDIIRLENARFRIREKAINPTETHYIPK